MDYMLAFTAPTARISKKLFVLFLFVILGFNCFTELGTVAQLLPEEEVRVLQTISSSLQNRYWTVSQHSCSGGGRFNVTRGPGAYSNVTCDCSFNNNAVCHVTGIELKRLNLSGVLPAEFANLTYLQVIDLTRNFINGSIPTAFGRLRHLTNLTMLGNRINGPIPEEIGDIATLEELVLEDNLLGGHLPQSIGNLSNLRRLVLSANNFTGEIPETFRALTNLTDFRIDGNQMSGKIPDFIGHWTNITRLDMQGTSMQGPIPSTISQLKKLSDLRISDLNGSSTDFRYLDMRDMNLRRLILRNCSLTGSIPDDIGKMSNLKTLDLSFNRLTGQIPATIESVDDHVLLNKNSLNGTIPNWISSSRENIDVSDNDFNGSSSNVGCQSFSVNLASSFSTSASNLESDTSRWCLRKDLPCPRKPQYHDLFINCGGGRTDFEGNVYEEDMIPSGPAYFFISERKWAHSTSGVFFDNGNAKFTASMNVTDPDIFQTARVAPNSLKYYGLCLRKGSYRVRLHFAEIMFSNDTTFSSLGRRIFDISIQGSVVLRDFNIAEKAKGVGKNVTMDFPNVWVNGSTLEIHLYWTGKGTTGIPEKGVYGPLISAISVTPNYNPNTGGLGAGAIAGIVAASVVLLVLILVVLRMKGYLGGDVEDKELRGAIERQTGYFTLRQIKAATNNFDPANKIGEGGFGPVFKGVLPDGAEIAVKQLSSKSKQGNREFVNEIGMISALQHPHLVRLYGCCIEGNQLLLIYEYMENNCLARALFGREEQRLNLDWATRKKICLGIARGLAHLHEESRLKIVHRDIKATNVLLDKDLNAKISDFGLAKLDEEENSHISTRIAGTIGYMAPEYATRGYLTDKADVYSFGVVILEIVSGKNNTNYRPKQEFVYLLDWAYVLQEQGNLLELVDPILGSNYSKTEAMKMLNLGLLCANPSPTLRPSMSSVVSMIEGKVSVQAPSVIKQSESNKDDHRFRTFEKLAYDSQNNISSGSRSQTSISTDGPGNDSTASIPSKDETRDRSIPSKDETGKLLQDLYDINLE